MPYKDKEKQKAAWRKHYADNKEYYAKRRDARRDELRAKVDKLKENTPCCDCGLFFQAVSMDFDHLGDKSHNIADMVRDGKSRAIWVEISKCEIVCSNCHRVRTKKRFNSLVI